MNAIADLAGVTVRNKTASRMPTPLPRIVSAPEGDCLSGRDTNDGGEPTWPFWTWFIENPQRNSGAA